jgi:hypothetical protein
MNVLHAPVNVGSQASSLAHAENEARRISGRPGRSWSANYYPNPLVSDGDHTADADRLGRLGRKLIRPLRPFFYGLKNIRRFDVLHLYFGMSMLFVSLRSPLWTRWDLPLWRALGKTVFMTFQGCDARIRSVAAQEPFSPCAPGICDARQCNSRADRNRSANIEVVSRACRKVFCLNPDLLQFVPAAEFLPYANLDPRLLERGRKGPPRFPVIVHAPSNRAIKGTRFVEEASAKLQEKIPHELRLVEDVPRAQALDLYAGGTMVVDQLQVGWYGGLAVEAMALGLPVVAYLNEKHLRMIPSRMREEIPVVSATPQTLPSILEELLQDPGRLRELGERGRSFVRRWHNPLKIARGMLGLYDDPANSFWDLFDQ